MGVAALLGLLAQAGDHQDVVVGAEGHHEQVHDDRQDEDEAARTAEVLEDRYSRTQRGGEAKPNRSHQVPGSDEALQKEPEDEEDQHRRHWEHDRVVVVHGHLQVDKDRADPTDQSPATSGSRVHSLLQGPRTVAMAAFDIPGAERSTWMSATVPCSARRGAPTWATPRTVAKRDR